MKKILLCMVLCLTMIIAISSCGAKEYNIPDDDTTDISDVDPEYVLKAKLDYQNPLIEVEKLSFSNIYDVDGQVHENTLSRPEIDLASEGAASINSQISNYYDDNFSMHFAMIDDLSGENVRPGEDIVNVSYSNIYDTEHDILIIIIEAQICVPGDEPTATYKVFYYDAMADIEIDNATYLEYLSLGESNIFAAVSKVSGYENVAISDDEPTSEDEVQFVYAICKDSNECDVYLRAIDGHYDVVTINLDVED